MPVARARASTGFAPGLIGSPVLRRHGAAPDEVRRLLARLGEPDAGNEQ